MTPAEIIELHGEFSSFHLNSSLLFILPIGVCVAAVLFYIFFIWYRDWLGKNTFTYRLFMLPISRMQVYFAKLMTILLFVLSLVMTQYLFLYIYKAVVELIIPATYRERISPLHIISYSELNIVLIPDILLFPIAYLIGTLVVMTLFTFILLERSYKVVGMLIGILFIGFVLFGAIGSFVGQYVIFNQLYLYPGEMVLFYSLLWIVLTFFTFMWNKKLITKKITV